MSSEAFSSDIVTVGAADKGGHLKLVQLLGWGVQSDDAVISSRGRLLFACNSTQLRITEKINLSCSPKASQPGGA